MSIAIYEGDFDDLSGGVVFSWFISNPRGPTAFAVGFVEVADMPWSLFYRRMAYALRSGSAGEAGRAGRSGQATAEAVQRVAGGYATEHRACRANAQAATRRSLPGHRTQPDQIGPCRLQLKMQPQRHFLFDSDPH